MAAWRAAGAGAVRAMTDFIVDPLVEFCVDVIGEIGYLGIFLLMLVESANIPMPSEATMLFAGFKVDDGDLTLLGITAAGVLGNIVGSWGGYAIGYWGREELLERHHIFHVSPKAMARVEDWFERYGAITVFFTRMLPIVRTFISTPAGAAHMNFWKFTIYTALGCIPWVLLLGLHRRPGRRQLGGVARQAPLLRLRGAALGLIALAVWAFVKWRRGKAEGGDDGSTELRAEGDPGREASPATEA